MSKRISTPCGQFTYEDKQQQYVLFINLCISCSIRFSGVISHVSLRKGPRKNGFKKYHGRTALYKEAVKLLHVLFVVFRAQTWAQSLINVFCSSYFITSVKSWTKLCIGCHMVPCFCSTESRELMSRSIYTCSGRKKDIWIRGCRK